MSASMRPTLLPMRARAMARLTATVVLPTPPLPEPTATILQVQKTVDIHGAETELAARGRHDPCVLPRAVPIVEAMAALVLVDHWMRQAAQNQTFKF